MRFQGKSQEKWIKPRDSCKSRTGLGDWCCQISYIYALRPPSSSPPLPGDKSAENVTILVVNPTVNRWHVKKNAEGKALSSAWGEGKVKYSLYCVLLDFFLKYISNLLSDRHVLPKKNVLACVWNMQWMWDMFVVFQAFRQHYQKKRNGNHARFRHA